MGEDHMDTLLWANMTSPTPTIEMMAADNRGYYHGHPHLVKRATTMMQCNRAGQIKERATKMLCMATLLLLHMMMYPPTVAEMVAAEDSGQSHGSSLQQENGNHDCMHITRGGGVI